LCDCSFQWHTTRRNEYKLSNPQHFYTSQLHVLAASRPGRTES
jgi:hypothetical protein